MTLSIIIPWRNRPEIKDTLRQNSPIFIKNHAEIIITNFGGDLTQLDFICREMSFENLKVISIDSPDFNKSCAMNIGASKANSASLFFLDADILLQDDFILEATTKVSKDYFLTIDRVFESNKLKDKNKTKHNHAHLNEIAYFTEFLTIQNQKVIVETNRVRFHDGSRSAPGLLFVSKSNFLKVHGMNSSLQYWGWEDLDIVARLQLASQLTHKKIGTVIHLSHDDNTRNLGNRTRSQSEMSNFSLCLSNYLQGNFKGTYQKDTNDWMSKMTEICYN